MILVWVIVGIVIIATLVAVLWAISIRKRRLISALQVEIENQGNMDSRYQLLVEDPQAGLTYKFSYNGEALQGVFKPDGKLLPAPPAKRSRRNSDGVENAIGFTGALANVMIGAGSLMGGFGKPIVQAGNKLFQGQVNAAKARKVSNDAAALSGGTAPTGQYDYQTPGAEQASQARLSGVMWSETAVIKAGSKLVVDLKVHAAYFPRDLAHPFKLKSRPSEGSNPPEVVTDGMVQIRGGFLSHKFYPPVTIIGTSALFLAFVYWLVRIGVLQ